MSEIAKELLLETAVMIVLFTLWIVVKVHAYNRCPRVKAGWNCKGKLCDDKCKSRRYLL